MKVLIKHDLEIVDKIYNLFNKLKGLQTTNTNLYNLHTKKNNKPLRMARIIKLS